LSVIFQLGPFYIESLTLPRAVVVTGARNEDTLTLERAGVFLGGAATVDGGTAAGEHVTVSMFRNTGAALLLGTRIADVFVRVFNESGANQTVGANVLILMRSTGH